MAEPFAEDDGELVSRLAPRMKGEGLIAEEAHRATHRAFIRIGRVLAIGGVLMPAVWIWEFDLSNLAA